MKTRVTEHFDTKLGIYLYWVWKWDLWDPPDLRAAHPTEYDWRHVICLPDKDRCVMIAKELASPRSYQPSVPMICVNGIDGPKLVPLIAQFDGEPICAECLSMQRDRGGEIVHESDCSSKPGNR